MPWDDENGTMEWDTAQRIFRIGMILSFLVAALGIVGEVAGRAESVLRAAEAAGLGQMLGWWNDIGEVLATVGSIAGILLGTVSILANASQSQVAGVAEGVEDVAQGVEQANETLDEQNEKLAKLDKLDAIDAGLDRQTDLLTQIRDRL